MHAKWFREAMLRKGFVLIKEDNLPSNKWQQGRIFKVFTGPDYCVCVVELRTTNGILKKRTLQGYV